MTDLVTQINALADAVGANSATIQGGLDALSTSQGDLSTLSTTQKSSLVVAINSLHSSLSAAQTAISDNASEIAAKSEISDSETVSNKTWSSQKVLDEITSAVGAAKTELIGGASSALDTFKELEDKLATYPDFAQVLSDLANAVRFDIAQALTAPQKAQARANIDAVSSAELAVVDSKIGNLTGFDPVARFQTAAGIHRAAAGI